MLIKLPGFSDTKANHLLLSDFLILIIILMHYDTSPRPAKSRKRVSG